MARVVVTGGCGFIGSHLVEQLVRQGDEVTVFDTEPPPEHLSHFCREARYVVGNITDPGSLREAITGSTDIVFHLAAVVGVDRYLARPLDVIDINFLGTRNALDLALEHNCQVVLASTSEVFGKNPAVPWPEDGDRVLGPTTAGRWTYSSAKALAEHLTLAYAKQYGLRATIVRYFNVFGPRQRPAYVLSRSLHRALNGLPMVVYDEGKQTRCFTYVDDAIAGTLLAAGNPSAAGEVFNLGSMVETTVREVVDLIAELTGTTASLAVDTRRQLGPAYQDLMRRVPDTAKAARLLGWSCRTSLRDGLSRTIAWARANPWWLALADSGASEEMAAHDGRCPVAQRGPTMTP